MDEKHLNSLSWLLSITKSLKLLSLRVGFSNATSDLDEEYLIFIQLAYSDGRRMQRPEHYNNKNSIVTTGLNYLTALKISVIRI